ncbi:hypothetical protein SAMN05216589_3007 [Halopseudomonas bauzanensis]|jgi:hypothetical protein|uniref:Uncharacterized protein n=1 Tax=Halopseudomonas bauzanensis TaxID=653930 RepID=A0A1I4P346_9GAMM|nr:hypothetical protein SAMN05216589_3007 [Halopseudomonas bauzanensis]SFM22188.1 hypothetical protein SAMN04487855_2763 [Halopseudomonas bauzanensis]
MLGFQSEAQEYQRHNSQADVGPKQAAAFLAACDQQQVLEQMPVNEFTDFWHL